MTDIRLVKKKTCNATATWTHGHILLKDVRLRTEPLVKMCKKERINDSRAPIRRRPRGSDHTDSNRNVSRAVTFFTRAAAFPALSNTRDSSALWDEFGLQRSTVGMD